MRTGAVVWLGQVDGMVGPMTRPSSPTTPAQETGSGATPTPSEETRGEKRIGTRTKKEWHNYLFDTTAHGYLDQEIPRFEALLSAAFSRDAEVEGLREALGGLVKWFDSEMVRSALIRDAMYYPVSVADSKAAAKVWATARAALLTAEGQKKGEG